MQQPVTGASCYQRSVPWQELEQDRAVAFQPMVLTMFLTPLLCKDAFTDVLLYPVP
jgi:hypothetical protein